MIILDVREGDEEVLKGDVVQVEVFDSLFGVKTAKVLLEPGYRIIIAVEELESIQRQISCLLALRESAAEAKHDPV